MQDLPQSMPYSLLRQEKPAEPPVERGYIPGIWRELDDLYRGGYQITARASQYLPKCVGEREDRHSERLRLASYIGYFGQIANVYVATLFRERVSVLPAGDADDDDTLGELPDPEVYQAFARNADLRGSSFEQVLRCAASTALVKGKALLAADFPPAPPGVTVATRADSDRLGVARPYAYELQPEELIDWEYDDVIRRRVELGDGKTVEFEVGRFSWVVRKRVVSRRDSPAATRGGEVEEFTIWYRRDDGVVAWATYRTKPLAPGAKHEDAEGVPQVASGETRFREIPIVEIRVPEPLWLGNIIGPLNKEHWQRRSALLAAQQRSLLVIPTVYLGPEVTAFGEAMPAERAQDPNRGDDPKARYERQGWLVLGEKDKLAFEGAPTDAFEVVDKQLDRLVDEIHRVSGRMAASISSTATAVGRSGESKAMDHRDFATVCMALGAVLSDGARRLYEIISGARSEEVVWTVHGFTNFEPDTDRAMLLEEGLQLDAIEVPSRTWRVEAKTRFAMAYIPGLSPETQAVIRKEIAAAVPDEADTNPLPPQDKERDDDEPGGTALPGDDGNDAASNEMPPGSNGDNGNGDANAPPRAASQALE